MDSRSYSRRSLRIAAVLLLTGPLLCVVGCNKAADTPPHAAPASDADPVVEPAAGSIAANGTLKPARQVQLGFGVEGTVESVEVEVGESVRAGRTLAVLDTTRLQRAVAQAEVELESSRARLGQLQPEAAPVPERVLAARATITSARAALTQAHVQAGQRYNQDVIDRWELEQAADALQDAQNEYQKVLDDPRTTTWAPSSPQARDLDDAQENYDIVLARYRLRAADHAHAVDIAQAEAQLAQGELTLYEAEHPIASQALTLAQLDVERARLALQAAQESLSRSTLVAPFDGIISAVPASVGEWASPGTPVVELVDISRWRVETNNVGELQISRIMEGQEAIVRVNAFQSEPLRGRVEIISPVAVVQQGDTTYTLIIELEDTDLNLRPGMTARVEILTE